MNYMTGRYWHRSALLLVLCPLLLSPYSFADEWPQWRGPTRDGVWREQGVVDEFANDQLVPRWRVPISSGYSGPTVADGRVYVSDRITQPAQIERVHCFEWDTGNKLWSFSYASEYRNVSYTAGPRASVLVHEGVAYSLGTMGHLHALDAATGQVRWKRDLNEEYAIAMPIWGIASSPLIEGDLLIVQIGGTPDACLVAFDRKTGVEKWRALKDRASYSSPIVIDQAGRRVLVCWTVENVVGLDLASGQILWAHPFGESSGMLVATPVFDGARLFFTGFFDGALMLSVDPEKLKVKQQWRRVGASEQQTKALHSAISTPLLLEDHIYGVDSYGELRCLEAGTGKRIWEDQSAVPRARWGTIHFVRNGRRIWMFNERGELLIATLSPKGLNIISRTQLIEPTLVQLNSRGGVTWAHPAFAYRHVFARNDEALVCASLEQ